LKCAIGHAEHESDPTRWLGRTESWELTLALPYDAYFDGSDPDVGDAQHTTTRLQAVRSTLLAESAGMGIREMLDVGNVNINVNAGFGRMHGYTICKVKDCPSPLSLLPRHPECPPAPPPSCDSSFSCTGDHELATCCGTFKDRAAPMAVRLRPSPLEEHILKAPLPRNATTGERAHRSAQGTELLVGPEGSVPQSHLSTLYGNGLWEVENLGWENAEAAPSGGANPSIGAGYRYRLRIWDNEDSFLCANYQQGEWKLLLEPAKLGGTEKK